MLYLTVTLVKVVQVYETYYVTHLLNPLPREEDLPSLRSNTLNSCRSIVSDCHTGEGRLTVMLL